MSEENWLPAVGYVGRYEVSDLGRVRSVERTVRMGRSHGERVWVARMLKQRLKRNGYWQVALYQDGKAQHIAVHRLVLEAFVGPCPDGLEACHGPNGQDDNSLANGVPIPRTCQTSSATEPESSGSVTTTPS